MAEIIGRKSQRLYSGDELLNHSKYDKETVGYFKDDLKKRLGESDYAQFKYDDQAIAFYNPSNRSEENRQGPIVLEDIKTEDGRDGLRIVIRSERYKLFHDIIEDLMNKFKLPIKGYKPERNPHVDVYGFLYEGENDDLLTKKEPEEKLATWDLGTPMELPEVRELILR